MKKQRRELILQYKNLHTNATKYSIAKYFVELGISQRTTYSVLANADKRWETNRAIGSGHQPVTLSKTSKKKKV